MPVSYQIVPNHKYPHQFTQINDNTEVVNTPAAGGGTVTSFLCVFTSPKGRDNKIITITNGLAEFMNEYGMGPFSLYGQPLMNAYASAAAASTSGASLHCLRVTPDDAAYSVATLIAKYKVEASTMTVRFVVKGATTPLTDIDDLSSATTISDELDSDGFTSVKLFSIAYRGRGVYGKNIRFQITNDKTADRENAYKNYNFNILRNEAVLERSESFNVTMSPNAVINNMSYFLEDVLNDADAGSQYAVISVNTDGFKAIYDKYATMNTATTLTENDFDVLLGIDKYTRSAITGYVVEAAEDFTPGSGETAVDLTNPTGIALIGGSDGALAEGAVGRETALNALYLRAFSGTIDENIRSKNRYPTTFILDANYEPKTKVVMASLGIARGDCMVMLDMGTGINTKASVKAYYDEHFKGFVNDRLVTIEPWCRKVRDPFTQKTVTVTSTHWLASEYAQHIFGWGGKHRPLAGNRFGVISGGIANSIYPVFDEDIDSETMDALAEDHINFAKYNPNQLVVRAMQDTQQTKQTALTEQNNMLVLLDVKRDVERLCASMEFDFSETEDIARFNAAVAGVTDRYAAAMVRGIGAYFDKNAWEAERGILHLYVEMVHRDLIKTTIIEIDVNRSNA